MISLKSCCHSADECYKQWQCREQLDQEPCSLWQAMQRAQYLHTSQQRAQYLHTQTWDLHLVAQRNAYIKMYFFFKYILNCTLKLFSSHGGCTCVHMVRLWVQVGSCHQTLLIYPVTGESHSVWQMFSVALWRNLGTKGRQWAHRTINPTCSAFITCIQWALRENVSQEHVQKY